MDTRKCAVCDTEFDFDKTGLEGPGVEVTCTLHAITQETLLIPMPMASTIGRRDMTEAYRKLLNPGLREEMTGERIVRRSWKERLFSWPWRPCVKYKRVHVPESYGELFICE